MSIVTGENVHIVPIYGPTVAVASTRNYTDYFHVKEAAHATIIIMTGTNTSASTFIVYESQTSGGTVKTALGTTACVVYKATATSASDTFSAAAAFTTSGLTTTTTGNLTWIIDVDAGQMTDTYPYLTVNISSAASTAIAALAILSGLRYASDTNLSAID